MDIKEILKFVKNYKFFKGMLTKSEAEIEEIENPAEDYYTVKLKTKAGLTWNTGEHAIYKIPGKKLQGGNSRILSVASNPEEGFMLLGFRTGEKISEFKKTLISMKKGDKIIVNGPFGWFRIKDETSPIVMFASGVGVTPIRAFMKALEHNESRAVEVVYASRSFYLFGEELDEIVKNNRAMKVHKTVSSKQSQEEIARLAQIYGNAAYYYVSGSTAIIESTRELLNRNGIQAHRIIDDTMRGY